MAIQKSLAKISIIVPCFNQADYIDECLQSISEQTFQNWECIIINDGSTDNPEDLISKWITKDSRFIYVKQQNLGLSSARNNGLLRASGEWVQFLDSDDILPRERLDYLMDQINNTSNADILISNFSLLHGQVIMEPYCELNPDNFNLKDIIMKWDVEFTIPIHCGLIRREIFNQFQFNENLKAKEDWLMWGYLFLRNPTVLYDSRKLAIYRIHNNSMTRKNDKNMFENDLRVTAYLRELILDNKELADNLLEQRIKYFSNQVYSLKKYLDKILNSNSYRFSKFLLIPLGWLKNYNKK